MAILWRGDYSTNDFSQWALHQWSENNDQGYTITDVGGSAAVIVSSPIPVGKSQAAKFTLRAHSLSGSSTTRSEVGNTNANTDAVSGHQSYYGWWTMFPGPAPTWPSFSGDILFFTQLGKDDGVGSSPFSSVYVQVVATGAPVRLGVGHQDSAGNDLLKATVADIAYDTWFKWIVRVLWHPTAGSATVWLNGAQVWDNSGFDTMLASSTNGPYWKQGLYDGDMPSDASVIHAGAVRGDSYASVDADLSGALSQPGPPHLLMR